MFSFQRAIERVHISSIKWDMGRNLARVGAGLECTRFGSRAQMESSNEWLKGPFLVGCCQIILQTFHKNILLNFLHLDWLILSQIKSMCSQNPAHYFSLVVLNCTISLKFHWLKIVLILLARDSLGEGILLYLLPLILYNIQIWKI